MKKYQDKPEFNPITIILETREEARTLLEIIDALDDFRCNEGGAQRLIALLDEQGQDTILTELSNAFSSMELEI